MTRGARLAGWLGVAIHLRATKYGEPAGLGCGALLFVESAGDFGLSVGWRATRQCEAGFRDMAPGAGLWDAAIEPAADAA